MRIHTLTLIVFTAVLAHSANSAKPSNWTTTEGAPSTSLRSPDACCDDVPVEKGLGAHETTAGEARMPDSWLPAINSAVAHLVERVHALPPDVVKSLPVHGWQVFDQIALRHLFRLEAADKTLEEMLEKAESINLRLENTPEYGPRMIAEARRFFLAHQAEMRAEANQYFLAHQAEMGEEAHQFLARQEKLTAGAHKFLLARQANTRAKAGQSFFAHQAEMTADAHESFRAHQAEMTAAAHQYFLAHEAEMTAEARQYFLAHWAEMTAKAHESFFADQAKMTAEADQSFLAQQAQLGEEAIMRYEMDPSAFFSITFQKAEADAAEKVDHRERSPIASLDLGILDTYRETYNTLHGCDLTLRKVMSRCIGDDAKLESLLSILKYDKKNKKYLTSVRMEPIADLTTVEVAAVKLEIPPGMTGVLSDKNVDIFVLFTSILLQKHPDQGSVIVAQLTKRFGCRQAALLVYKMRWKWRLSFKNLKAELFDHLVKEGTTPDMLHYEIMEARVESAIIVKRSGYFVDEFETRCGDVLLNDYRAHFARANRKRKRASDTSAGPS